MMGADVKTAGSEPALSAAEPVATKLRMIVSHATMGQTDGEGLSTNDICVKITALRNELFKRAQSTAPSVAVKALEWKQTVDYMRGSERREQWMAETPWGNLTIWHYRLPEDELKHGPKFRVGAHLTPYAPHEIDYPSLEAAKEAAQKDYASRVRLALSAQVQDVAGWQSMDTAPKDGKHCLLAVKAGPFVYAVQGAYSMGEWGNAADIHSEPLCWMPLTRILPVYLPWTAEFAAAAPKKQEASHVTSQ